VPASTTDPVPVVVVFSLTRSLRTKAILHLYGLTIVCQFGSGGVCDVSITVQMAVKVDDCVSAADIVSTIDARNLTIKISVSIIAKDSFTLT